jgi:hypothetical protein
MDFIILAFWVAAPDFHEEYNSMLKMKISAELVNHMIKFSILTKFSNFSTLRSLDLVPALRLISLMFLDDLLVPNLRIFDDQSEEKIDDFGASKSIFD